MDFEVDRRVASCLSTIEPQEAKFRVCRGSGLAHETLRHPGVLNGPKRGVTHSLMTRYGVVERARPMEVKILAYACFP